MTLANTSAPRFHSDNKYTQLIKYNSPLFNKRRKNVFICHLVCVFVAVVKQPLYDTITIYFLVCFACYSFRIEHLLAAFPSTPLQLVNEKISSGISLCLSIFNRLFVTDVTCPFAVFHIR